MYRHSLKRLLDILFALCSIVVTLPLFFLVSLAILLFDPGPILFVHTRVGRNGSLFKIYKFRSMPPDTPLMTSDSVGQLSISPLGHFLRRTSLDELPQLFNILFGDMSFIGPRPALPSQFELLHLRQASNAIALRPGLSGYAQVTSFDGMTTFEKASRDSIYYQSLSFSFDLVIFFRTFLYLFKKPPVY